MPQGIAPNNSTDKQERKSAGISKKQKYKVTIQTSKSETTNKITILAKAKAQTSKNETT
ncbi:27285_t:CDS:1, partial [Racocetra persica]